MKVTKNPSSILFDSRLSLTACCALSIYGLDDKFGFLVNLFSVNFNVGSYNFL